MKVYPSGTRGGEARAPSLSGSWTRPGELVPPGFDSEGLVKG